MTYLLYLLVSYSVLSSFMMIALWQRGVMHQLQCEFYKSLMEAWKGQCEGRKVRAVVNKANRRNVTTS